MYCLNYTVLHQKRPLNWEITNKYQHQNGKAGNALREKKYEESVAKLRLAQTLMEQKVEVEAAENEIECESGKEYDR